MTDIHTVSKQGRTEIDDIAALVKYLMSKKIKLVAFDFDNTITNVHSSRLFGPQLYSSIKSKNTTWSTNPYKYVGHNLESWATWFNMKPSLAHFSDPNLFKMIVYFLISNNISVAIASFGHKAIIRIYMDLLFGKNQQIFHERNVVTPNDFMKVNGSIVDKDTGKQQVLSHQRAILHKLPVQAPSVGLPIHQLQQKSSVHVPPVVYVSLPVPSSQQKAPVQVPSVSLRQKLHIQIPSQKSPSLRLSGSPTLHRSRSPSPSPSPSPLSVKPLSVKSIDDHTETLGDKNPQIHLLSKRYNISLSQILLLDDRSKNVDNVTQIGSSGFCCPNGISSVWLSRLMGNK